jgi:hypothetical protein
LNGDLVLGSGHTSLALNLKRENAEGAIATDLLVERRPEKISGYPPFFSCHSRRLLLG